MRVAAAFAPSGGACSSPIWRDARLSRHRHCVALTAVEPDRKRIDLPELLPLSTTNAKPS
jgi:hypothetical protein